MKIQKIKFQDQNKIYSILIGNNILRVLSGKIKKLCPYTRKIAIIFDQNIPNRYKKIILDNLKRYELVTFNFSIKGLAVGWLCTGLYSQKVD